MAEYLKLIDYCEYKARMQGKTFIIQPYMEEIAHTLELVFLGILPEDKVSAAISIPPRHIKTTLVHGFIEWSMGQIPDCEFIYATYGMEFSKENTNEIRQTMKSEWYQELFPHCRIAKGKADKQEHFTTTAGGIIRAIGMDTGVIGKGAGKLREGKNEGVFGGAIIVDDPITEQDSRSPVMRDKIYQTITGALETRKNTAKTPTVLIMQRLSVDDPIGQLLRDHSHDWHYVRMPAINLETGVELWPGRVRNLLRMKEIDPFKFWGQYQQEPQPRGGGVIKREWWNFYDDVEEVKQRCTHFMIFADTAMKTNKDNDPSVLQLWGFEAGNFAYLIDQVRGRWDFPELLRQAQAFYKKSKITIRSQAARALFIEDRSSGTALIDALKEKGLPAVAWLPKKFNCDGDDKVSRAKASSWSIYGGCVWIPRKENAVWVDGFLDECTHFSEDLSHSHDDQVDCLTMSVLTWRSFGGGMGADDDFD